MPVVWAVPTFAIAGLGMGLAYAPLSLIVLREAPPETQGAASSALSLLRHARDGARDGCERRHRRRRPARRRGPGMGLAAAFVVAILVGAGGLAPHRPTAAGTDPTGRPTVAPSVTT